MSKVALVNRATGKALDHYYGREIVALNDDTSHPHHQWWKQPVDGGYFAFKNVATNMVLDHYHGESIEAKNDDIKHSHHQWQLVDAGGGYFALKNKGTGKVLDHYAGQSIKALDDNITNPHHHWKLVEIHGGASKSGVSSEPLRKTFQWDASQQHGWLTAVLYRNGPLTLSCRTQNDRNNEGLRLRLSVIVKQGGYILWQSDEYRCGTRGGRWDPGTSSTGDDSWTANVPPKIAAVATDMEVLWATAQSDSTGRIIEAVDIATEIVKKVNQAK